MGDLSDNFSRHEFKCRCGCGFDTVDAELIKVLEKLRLILGGPRIVISSGCRCQKHNAEIGGSPNSQHLKGKAADIKVERVHPDMVADCLGDSIPDKYGIGRYIDRTHIDVRSTKARWDLS